MRHMGYEHDIWTFGIDTLGMRKWDCTVLSQCSVWTAPLSPVSPGVAAFKTAACRVIPDSLGARSPSHHARRATAVLPPTRLSRCHARAAWQTHRNASQTHRSPPFPSTIFAATRDIRFVALTDSLRTNLSPLRPRTEHCSNPSHPPTEPGSAGWRPGQLRGLPAAVPYQVPCLPSLQVVVCLSGCLC